MKIKLVLITAGLLFTASFAYAQAIVPTNDPKNFDECDPDNYDCVVIADMNYMYEKTQQMRSLLKECNRCTNPQMQHDISDMKIKMDKMINEIKSRDHAEKGKSGNATN
jgi:hypothetical protein